MRENKFTNYSMMDGTVRSSAAEIVDGGTLILQAISRGKEIADKKTTSSKKVKPTSTQESTIQPRGVHYLDRHGHPSAKPDKVEPEIYAIWMRNGGGIIETATREVRNSVIEQIGYASANIMLTHRALAQLQRERLNVPTDIGEDEY